MRSPASDNLVSLGAERVARAAAGADDPLIREGDDGGTVMRKFRATLALAKATVAEARASEMLEAAASGEVRDPAEPLRQRHALSKGKSA